MINTSACKLSQYHKYLVSLKYTKKKEYSIKLMKSFGKNMEVKYSICILAKQVTKR